MTSIKRQKDRTLKEELPRSVDTHMLLEISGEITKNEGMDSKQKQHLVVDLTGDQPSVFIGRTDVEAETTVLWPLDEKS